MNCLAFANKHQMFQGGFRIIVFLDILKTDSVRHASEVLKTMSIHKTPKVDDWVYLKPRAMFEITWDF